MEKVLYWSGDLTVKKHKPMTTGLSKSSFIRCKVWIFQNWQEVLQIRFREWE